MESLKIDWKSFDYLNANDLNRVEEWTAYLSGILDGYGYHAEIVKKPAIDDPHTLLLLHGESIEDSSRYKVTLTNQGVTVSTAQSKFAGKSLYFNGSSKITFPSAACDFGEGDFTIDWWERPTEGGYHCKMATQSKPGTGLVLGAGGDGSKIYASSPAGKFDIFESWSVLSLTPEVWTHFAVVRSGNRFLVFKNGKLVGEKQITKPISNDLSIPATLGTNAGGASFFAGYMDEIRISNVARWTVEFTPPTAPYKTSIDSKWTDKDIPSVSNIDRIRSNINALRDGYFAIPEWRDLILGQSHDFGQQNAMEWDLQTCYNWIELMARVFVPSGIYNSGGVMYYGGPSA